jgi:hypothetical protein
LTMTKTLEIILIYFLALFSFSLGVKYSESVREKAGWMFETDMDEALPDLANPANPQMNIRAEAKPQMMRVEKKPKIEKKIEAVIEAKSSAIVDNAVPAAE